MTGPESGVARTLFIVQRGLVRARAPDARPGATAFEFAPGRCSRSTPSSPRARRRGSTRRSADLFCYELDAADVAGAARVEPAVPALLRCDTSTACSSRSGGRCARPTPRRLVSDRPLLRPLASAIRRAPVACPRARRRCGGAGAHATRSGSAQSWSSMPRTRREGIFTERDLVRHAAAGELGARAADQRVHDTRPDLASRRPRRCTRRRSSWRVTASGTSSCATAASSPASYRSAASSPCSASRCAR